MQEGNVKTELISDACLTVPKHSLYTVAYLYHIGLCTEHYRERYCALEQNLTIKALLLNPIFTPYSSLFLLFFPHCWRQRWVAVLLCIPKGPSLIIHSLPCNVRACLFSAVFVYHNSLFDLEASTTVPTGKHQVLNAIPRHACLSNLRSNECHSSSPGGPFCHISVYVPTLLLMAPPERFAQMCLLFPQSGSQSFRSGLVYQ